MGRVVEEIRWLFAETRSRHARTIDSLGAEYSAWVVRFSDCYGVAVPYNGVEPVAERFHSARLTTRHIVIDGEEHQCLVLTSDVEGFRHEFASLCGDFVEPGENGERRLSLLENPQGWWERWTELLGNAVAHKNVHGILGELLVMEQLIKAHRGPCRWGGIHYATHDIETNEHAYEVKATLKRYDTTVTISSQFQLESDDLPLSLVFCRFEESLHGDCIDDVVVRLVDLGLDLSEINAALNTFQLEQGSSARQKRFKLLEMREYQIDDAFPRITAASFKNNAIPESIIQINYTIDLLGIQYRSFLG